MEDLYRPSLHDMLVAGALSERKTLKAFIKDDLEKAVSEGIDGGVSHVERPSRRRDTEAP